MQKFIQNTNDLYAVTENGKVISYNKYKKGHILKAGLDGNGYPAVMIKYDDGKFRMRHVHRLVAEAFIPNPDNLPVINHINERKTDNRVENLEWTTQRQNVVHSIPHRNYRNAKMSGAPKRVALLDDNLEIERVFYSIRDAARYIQGEKWNSAYVMISRVCHRHVGHITACGKKWTFIDNGTFLNYINENPEWLDEENLKHSKLKIRTMLEKTIIKYNPKTGDYTPFKEIVEIKKEDGSRAVRLF